MAQSEYYGVIPNSLKCSLFCNEDTEDTEVFAKNEIVRAS